MSNIILCTSLSIHGITVVLQRAVVWGVIVTLIGSPLLILTCTWHCCTVWACKRNDDEDNDRYKMARNTCIVLLLLQIILSM